ncbi:MAG TPA: hypothetical protein VK589_24565 [Chryseolinea sp.]|nr:hypothetical protein [Chryseolinea sp.]
MENFNTIEFHHTRDFSRKMNATFEFIRQNFKSLGKSILVIAGPPVIVASLIIATFLGEFMDLTRAVSTNSGDPEVFETYFMSVNFWLQILLMFVLFLLSSIMSIATINNYIILYEEKRTNNIDVVEVWRRVRETFWMYFGTTLVFFLLAIAAYIALLIPVGILAAISPALIFLGMMAMVCAIVYLMVSVSLTYFIRAYEKKGFFDAAMRSFKLVRDKWWSTFGLIFVLYIVMMTISYIFLIPWYIAMVTTALHNTSTEMLDQPMMTWPMMLLFTLYYLAQIVLGALPNIGIAFQYFNLVERKEAKGLLGRIDTLGQSQPQSTSDEQY